MLNLRTPGAIIKPFIGRKQALAIAAGLAGEESDYFTELVIKLADTITAMPVTYEQDGLGEQAVIHLHYFCGNQDWWITEKDCLPEQQQAFGLMNMGDGAELGYVSIVELTGHNVEIDLHWQPVTLAQLRQDNPHA